MIPSSLISELANHVWQSTATAAVIALLALALRTNAARLRYALWFIASAKFVVPFSLLMFAGSFLQPAAPHPPGVPAVSAVIGQIAEPFSSPGHPVPAIAHWNTQPGASDAASFDRTTGQLLLLALWACGFLGVVFSWYRKWRRLGATASLAKQIGLIDAVPVLSSPSLLEPGVFGVLHPAIVVPEGISERLTAPQLEAVLRHELSHVLRRDNLSAAFHMAVEAVFWFHPLVWWIGARLMEERERACDEAVLASGSEAYDYAEGILNVCKFYLESPLTCVSGVTGADLKKRVVRIVTKQVLRNLDLSRKLLLSVAGVLAVATPVTLGLLHAVQLHAQTQPASTSQDLSGSWQGTLQAQKALRTVLKVTKAKDGYAATLYSIDQGGQGIPVTAISVQGPAVKYSILMIDGSYEGKLSADGNTITGTWTQGGRPTPLALTRATPETAWAIPEPPARVPPMDPNAAPSFEVATIKPSKPDAQGRAFMARPRRFVTVNTSLASLMTFVYDIQARQIVGAASWMDSDKYDVEVQPDGEGQPNLAQWKMILQKLLADRCKLTFHHDQKELSVYALVLGKSGSKLAKSQGDPAQLPGLFFRGPGVLAANNASMVHFGNLMQSAVLDRPVVDKTGLTGRYDFLLKWTPDESQFAGMGVKIPPPSSAPDAPPDLFTAVQEQLGLKFDPTKAPVDVLVIDHVEKPSAN